MQVEDSIFVGFVELGVIDFDVSEWVTDDGIEWIYINTVQCTSPIRSKSKVVSFISKVFIHIQ